MYQISKLPYMLCKKVKMKIQKKLLFLVWRLIPGSHTCRVNNKYFLRSRRSVCCCLGRTVVLSRIHMIIVCLHYFTYILQINFCYFCFVIFILVYTLYVRLVVCLSSYPIPCQLFCYGSDFFSELFYYLFVDSYCCLQ